MAATANRHRRHVEFEVGDLVWLKLQPYRQHSVARPLSAKLSRRFFGPFEVLERVGPVAYRLRLPEGSRIHNVFHVSLLKEFVAGEGPPDGVQLPVEFVGDRPVVSPERILDSKFIWREGKPTKHILVRWSDGAGTTSWEPSSPILDRFPELSLEDKGASNGGGVVTNSQDSMPIATMSPDNDSPTLENEDGEPDACMEAEEVETEACMAEKGAETKGTVVARELRPRKNLKQPEKYRDYVAK